MDPRQKHAGMTVFVGWASSGRRVWCWWPKNLLVQFGWVI